MREQFRNKVLYRTEGLCAFCSASAVDAHHIMERALWPDGGYIVENGCAMCEKHHILAERGVITPRACKMAMRWLTRPLPEPLSSDKDYDKWGNELKAPKDLHIKYPKTPYLYQEVPVETFLGYEVVVTEKMDGGNVCLTSEGVHARSVDGTSHPSLDLLKSIWSSLRHMLTVDFQYFGEWMYATHSIDYTELPTYFLGFSVYDQLTCEFLAYEEVVEEFNRLGLQTVPYLGMICADDLSDFNYGISSFYNDVVNRGGEGIVIRSEYSFHYSQFAERVSKLVRPNHVQTDEHWSKNWRKTNAKISG
jgi:hypothetical protein